MKSRLWGAVCASFIVSYSSFALAVSFTPLGFLNSGTISLANGISADGTVVVGSANSFVSSTPTPFIWTAASGMQSLGSISGTEFLGSASAISADGSVVVGQSNNLAYRWTATTGKVTLGSFPMGTTSSANDVSADGSVVVGFATTPVSYGEAFRWTTGTSIVGLGDYSSASAVSADGSMVAGATAGAAGIWTEASGWTLIGDCCSFTNATAISADGSVVGGDQDVPGLSSMGAFIWTEADGYTLLGNLGQAGIPVTVPTDISGDGSIWVGTEFDSTPSDSSIGPQAVIWDQANGIRALRDVLSAEGIDLTEWVTLTANGVSANGSIIAGWGTKTDGIREAWIAQISPAPTAVDLVASILPSSRSVQVGNVATAFATIINTGSATATDCGIAPLTSVQANFSYQTTDASNALIGVPDTPIDIAAGGNQSYVFAFTPTASFSPVDVQLSFDCTNTDPAPVTVGLNTLLLAADSNPVPDMVALSATLNGDGIVNLASTGVFAVATVNVGIASTITVSADTGSASLPVSIALCETDPATSVCINPTVPTLGTVTTSIAADATLTFAFFVTGTDTVPFDPANNRIFVRFQDAGGVTRGSTSVAVRTL